MDLTNSGKLILDSSLENDCYGEVILDDVSKTVNKLYKRVYP